MMLSYMSFIHCTADGKVSYVTIKADVDAGSAIIECHAFKDIPHCFFPDIEDETDDRDAIERKGLL